MLVSMSIIFSRLRSSILTPRTVGGRLNQCAVTTGYVHIRAAVLSLPFLHHVPDTRPSSLISRARPWVRHIAILLNPLSNPSDYRLTFHLFWDAYCFLALCFCAHGLYKNL